MANIDAQITMTPETSRGVYSNALKVGVNDNEVVLDFAQIVKENEQTMNGLMVSRVIVTPKSAEGMANSILTTLKKHKTQAQQ